MQKEFVMTDHDFANISSMVYDSVGIVLGEHKREMVYSRLARRLRLHGLTYFSDYLDYLEHNKESEFSDFINAITTNLTSFFRENHHFEYLEQLIPTLKEKHQRDKRIRIWSAGCSTGEEPYSIAMTLAEAFASGGWDLKILATDLDSNVLAKASQGIYSKDQVAGITSTVQKKFFKPSADHSQLQVKDSLKQLIYFKRLNLLQDWPMNGPFDVIFCRNVVIYFDMPTKNKLFSRYAQMLDSGSHLFLGHSESIPKEQTAFNSIGKTMYQRK